MACLSMFTNSYTYICLGGELCSFLLATTAYSGGAAVVERVHAVYTYSVYSYTQRKEPVEHT